MKKMIIAIIAIIAVFFVIFFVIILLFFVIFVMTSWHAIVRYTVDYFITTYSTYIRVRILEFDFRRLRINTNNVRQCRS